MQGTVAQLVEQLTNNQSVAGSIPAGTAVVSIKVQSSKFRTQR